MVSTRPLELRKLEKLLLPDPDPDPDPDPGAANSAAAEILR